MHAKICSIRLGFALMVLCLATPVLADGSAAVKAYEAKDYAAAYEQFRELAELGHAESQRNLGVMTLRGEGVLMNKRRGYAWLKLAALGGDESASKIEESLRPVFEESAAGEVAELLAKFGPDRLQADLMPRILPNCEYSTQTGPRLKAKEASRVVRYPAEMADKLAEESVHVEFQVGADGKARSYRIVAGIHPENWITTIEQAKQRWTWTPAMKNGVAVASSASVLIKFSFEDRAYLLDYSAVDKKVEQIHQKAQKGDAASAYVYALLLSNHPKYNKPWSESLPWMQRAAIAGIPQAQYQLGYSLIEGRGCEADAAKGLKWLQRAAQADLPEAQVMLARLLQNQPGTEGARKPIFWLQRAARSNDRTASLALAASLATDPDPAVRDPARALLLAKDLVAKSKDDPLVLEVHAAALAANNSFVDASAVQRRAISLAEGYKWNVESMRQRLQAYEQGQPWTGSLLAL